MNLSTRTGVTALLIGAVAGCSTSTKAVDQMTLDLQRDRAVAVLESLESGDLGPVAFIHPDSYTQHNLSVADGLAGFGAVLANAHAGGFKVDVIRAFADGDFAFTHTVYDFFGPKVGFDVFRVADGRIVEHWDVIQSIPPRSEWKNSNGKFLVAVAPLLDARHAPVRDLRVGAWNGPLRSYVPRAAA